MELTFLLYLVCTSLPVEGDPFEECQAQVAPYWFESEAQCNAHRLGQHKAIVAMNGLYTFKELCVTSKVPVIEGDPV